MTLDGEIIVKNDDHNDPICAQKNLLAVQVPAAGSNPIPDVTDEMKRYVDFQAITNTTSLPSAIATSCFAEFSGDFISVPEIDPIDP